MVCLGVSHPHPPSTLIVLVGSIQLSKLASCHSPAHLYVYVHSWFLSQITQSLQNRVSLLDLVGQPIHIRSRSSVFAVHSGNSLESDNERVNTCLSSALGWLWAYFSGNKTEKRCSLCYSCSSFLVSEYILSMLLGFRFEWPADRSPRIWFAICAMRTWNLLAGVPVDRHTYRIVSIFTRASIVKMAKVIRVVSMHWISLPMDFCSPQVERWLRVDTTKSELCLQAVTINECSSGTCQKHFSRRPVGHLFHCMRLIWVISSRLNSIMTIDVSSRQVRDESVGKIDC